MAVNQDSEVTAETKIDENDGGGTACFIGVEIEKDVPPVWKVPQKLQSRDGLHTVDARNL